MDRKLRILITDDSKLLRKKLRTELEKLDCEVLEAANGKESVEIVLQQMPDGSYIVRTPAGVKCTAIFNVFTGCFFADDVYGVLDD